MDDENRPEHDDLGPNDLLGKLGNDFSIALMSMKMGARVRRKGWVPHGMFIFLVRGSTFKVNRPPLSDFYEEGTEITYHSHIDVRLPDGSIGVWTPTTADLLAPDWETCLD